MMIGTATKRITAAIRFIQTRLVHQDHGSGIPKAQLKETAENRSKR
jgi:hypothetical protein